jgi:hypothetical protein
MREILATLALEHDAKILAGNRDRRFGKVEGERAPQAYLYTPRSAASRDAAETARP